MEMDREVEGKPKVREASIVDLDTCKGSEVEKEEFEKDEVEDMSGEHVGWLFKKGRIMKNWKKRFFVLRGQKLTYYVDKDKPESRRGSIHLKSCSSLVLSQTDKVFCIYIKTPERNLELKSEDEESTRQWYDSLKSAMQRKKTNKVKSFFQSGEQGNKLLSGFLGKSKVMNLDELDEDWMQNTNRWSTFTMRYFVLYSTTAFDPASGKNKDTYTLAYYTDETCKTQRGSLQIESTSCAAFQSAKIPFHVFAEQDLKCEIPIYLTLSSLSWVVILCPRKEDDALQWRTAFDTVIYQLKIQEGAELKDTLQMANGTAATSMTGEGKGEGEANRG